MSVGSSMLLVATVAAALGSLWEATALATPAPASGTAVWSQHGGVYTLSVGGAPPLFLHVDAAHGGRITSLEYGTQELLYPGSGQLQGSTFWSSPQATWGWPPAAAIDADSYQSYITTSGDGRQALVLRSWHPEPATGLYFGKTITYDSARQAVQIDYLFDNQSGGLRWVSPWEVTRVPLGGIVFFPKESDYKGASVLVPTQESSSMAWLHSSAETQGKLFRDGAEAWVAHAYKHVLFIKKYQENVSTQDFALIGQAGAEAEIELYANPQAGYVEVEDQGPYRPLANGAQRTWTVLWYVTALPSSLGEPPLEAQSLVDLARRLISK